jgi:hypothetical protein
MPPGAELDLPACATRVCVRARVRALCVCVYGWVAYVTCVRTCERVFFLGGGGGWGMWYAATRDYAQVIRSTVSVMFVLNIDEIVYEVRAHCVSLERIPMLGLQHNMCVITVALAYSIAY